MDSKVEQTVQNVLSDLESNFIVIILVFMTTKVD